MLCFEAPLSLYNKEVIYILNPNPTLPKKKYVSFNMLDNNTFFSIHTLETQESIK